MYKVRFGASLVLNNEHQILSRAQQRQMVSVLESAPTDQKPLTGTLQGHYRWRHSDKRAVYRVDEESKTVVVIAIGMRRDSEIYDEAAGRTND